MAKRDYYEALGLSRHATPEEIKAAYRKLARKYHPDVNKAADAQARFTEIQNAYDTLSDPQKRRAYDQFGEAGVSGSAAASAASSGPHFRWTTGSGAGGPEFDAEELGSMFEAFFGGQSGYGPFGQPETRAPRSGRSRAGRARQSEPVSHDLQISFLTAAKGGTERLRLGDGGRTRTIEVKIPAGVWEGSQLRIKGAAPDGSDLLLTLHVGEHPIFKRVSPNGSPSPHDLMLELPLTVAEATLGTTVTVPTLEGSVELKVPAGTSSGRKLRLRSRGIRPASGEPGDLYVVTRIVAPDPSMLDDAQRDLLRSLRQPNPRSDPAWSTKP